MPPASATRAGVTPEASRDRSSGTFGQVNSAMPISLTLKRAAILIAFTTVHVFISIASVYLIVIGFAFWWESRNYTSYLFRNSFLLYIPILILFLTCFTLIIQRRLVNASFNIIDIFCFLLLPGVAALVFAIFYGFFGKPPSWL